MVARGIGTAIGLAEMTAGFLGYPVNTSILAFAGGLLVAPIIAGAQQRRNGRRGDGD